MQISKGGRVVLIDDTAEEALPLLAAFAKSGIPSIYYDGRPENLPESPLEGIRFIFLDIELQGMGGQSEKNKASALVGRLKKIISVQNGPYVIIFWTKHSEIIDKILENCEKAAISPKGWIDLEKINCKEPDGTYVIEKISEKLKGKLQSFGAFKLYVEWENIVQASASKFTTQFSSHVSEGNDWSKNTSSLFHRLYTTFTDEKRTKDPLLQFKSACFLLNRSFLDTLQGSTTKDLQLPDGFTLQPGSISCPTLCKLNTSLFLVDTILDKPAPGYVYIDKSLVTRSLLIENTFKEGKCPFKAQLCTIILTPECDIAHDKTLHIFTKCNPPVAHCVHRIVYGLLYPMSCKSMNEERKLLEKKGEAARFLIGPIWYKNGCHLLIVNFASISFKSELDINNDPIFGLRRDLMFDLQSKAANHVNRLGNFLLS